MSKQISVFIFQAELDTKEVRIAELEAEVERLEVEVWILKAELLEKNASIACLTARQAELEAEITAWEAKASLFVDQGELVERLKSTLDDIAIQTVFDIAKGWAAIPKVEYDAAMEHKEGKGG